MHVDDEEEISEFECPEHRHRIVSLYPPEFPAGSPPWTRGDGAFRYLDTRVNHAGETTVRTVSVTSDRVMIRTWKQHTHPGCIDNGCWIDVEFPQEFSRETASLLVRTLYSLGVK